MHSVFLPCFFFWQSAMPSLTLSSFLSIFLDDLMAFCDSFSWDVELLNVIGPLTLTFSCAWDTHSEHGDTIRNMGTPFGIFPLFFSQVLFYRCLYASLIPPLLNIWMAVGLSQPVYFFLKFQVSRKKVDVCDCWKLLCNPYKSGVFDLPASRHQSCHGKFLSWTDDWLLDCPMYCAIDESIDWLIRYFSLSGRLFLTLCFFFPVPFSLLRKTLSVYYLLCLFLFIQDAFFGVFLPAKEAVPASAGSRSAWSIPEDYWAHAQSKTCRSGWSRLVVRANLLGIRVADHCQFRLHANGRGFPNRIKYAAAGDSSDRPKEHSGLSWIFRKCNFRLISYFTLHFVNVSLNNVDREKRLLHAFIDLFIW